MLRFLRAGGPSSRTRFPGASCPRGKLWRVIKSAFICFCQAGDDITSFRVIGDDVHPYRTNYYDGPISSCCCCCCFLTLTDPLRIQPWSQDRRNQTKSNRESEISMESRQKRTDKEVASKGHRRDKIENINKHTQTVETN